MAALRLALDLRRPKLACLSSPSSLQHLVHGRSALHVGQAVAASGSQSRMPSLCAEDADGSMRVIEEDDLYRYTRHRWLFDEIRQLSIRHLPFSLPKLIDTAIRAVDGRASSCTRLLKCREGLHNKVFRLTLDDGSELVAKLPNPNAGPAHYTTASEVATRRFLLEGLRIPVPRVLAWSSDPGNPVGAEFIIEEAASGRPLGSLWYEWPRKSKLEMIIQIVEMEKKVASATFSQLGCIYLREDLASHPFPAPLAVTGPRLSPDFLDQFALGPLASAELWSAGRDRMRLDRGPWSSAIEFVQAMGKAESEWVRKHGSARMNHARSLEEAETPESMIELLSRYLQLSPHLLPAGEGQLAPTLWHPDLHLDNVFVDPETRIISSVIDWQSAIVAPLYYQSRVPRLFRHFRAVADDWTVPERPPNYDDLSEAEKMQADREVESEVCHKYYRYQTYKRNPRHWEALDTPIDRVRRKPVWLVSGAWQNRDVFFLRQALLEVTERWDEVEPGGQACPVCFSEKELSEHAKEEENIDGVGALLSIFRDQGLLPADGMVEPDDYEGAKANCEHYKDVFLNLAKSEQERELFARLWPYQDTEV